MKTQAFKECGTFRRKSKPPFRGSGSVLRPSFCAILRICEPHDNFKRYKAVCFLRSAATLFGRGNFTLSIILRLEILNRLDIFFGTTKETENRYKIWNMECSVSIGQVR
jgi:hypothetical protein